MDAPDPIANNCGCYGRLFVMVHTKAPEDDGEYGHKHARDHITFVTHGRVLVKWKYDDGTSGEKEFTAPTFFIQAKDVMHRVSPIVEGSVWWCVFAMTDAEAGDARDGVAAMNNPYA
jgi:hypothetical protein